LIFSSYHQDDGLQINPVDIQLFLFTNSIVSNKESKHCIELTMAEYDEQDLIINAAETGSDVETDLISNISEDNKFNQVVEETDDNAVESEDTNGKSSSIVPLMSLPLSETKKESSTDSGIVPLMSISTAPPNLLSTEIKPPPHYGFGQSTMPDWGESYGYYQDYNPAPEYTDHYQYQQPELPLPCFSNIQDKGPVPLLTNENVQDIRMDFDLKMESKRGDSGDESPGVIPLMSMPTVIPLMSLNSNVSPLGVEPLLPLRDVEPLYSRQSYRSHANKPYDRDGD
jgi:hypothetical protein